MNKGVVYVRYDDVTDDFNQILQRHCDKLLSNYDIHIVSREQFVAYHLAISPMSTEEEFWPKGVAYIVPVNKVR